jgi:hypothetical protein
MGALRVQHLCAHRQAAGLSAVQVVDFHVSQGSEEAAKATSDLFCRRVRGPLRGLKTDAPHGSLLDH